MGRDRLRAQGIRAGRVSIHAPRMGRDRFLPQKRTTVFRFNSRAPHGARHRSLYAGFFAFKFQFTRPAWGATDGRSGCRHKAGFQFTRPAWGATSKEAAQAMLDNVSIHAPRMGRDD